MNTNTTNTTAAAITADALLALADRPECMSDVGYNTLWETAKAHLSREDHTLVWAELKARSIERKLGHFAGRKFLAKHPDIQPSAPAWAKPKADAEAAPAKQEKKPVKAKKAAAPKAEAAPAKQEKAPAKAKDPTTKQLLANMLVSMDSMSKGLAKLDARMDALEGKLEGMSAELTGLGKTVKKLAK